MGDVAGVINTIAGGIGAIAALVAAGAAVFAAWFTRRIMQAGQEQVKVSQDQFRQAVEAEQDAQLPVLVPIEPPFSTDSPDVNRQPGYDANLQYTRIAIRNAGPGVALNIWGVVFGPEPEPMSEAAGLKGQHHSRRFVLPLDAGKESHEMWTQGGVAVGGTEEIADKDMSKHHSLYAHRKATYGESLRGKTVKVGRLTLTYSDIFGRKHAAIYDITSLGQWELVDFLRNIAQDLGELELEALSHIPVYIAPKAQTTMTD